MRYSRTVLLADVLMYSESNTACLDVVNTYAVLGMRPLLCIARCKVYLTRSRDITRRSRRSKIITQWLFRQGSLLRLVQMPQSDCGT